MIGANSIIDTATVKSMIKILSAADDTILEKIIDGTSIFFENYCNSKFINQSLTEVYDGSGAPNLFLDFCPVSALTEVKFQFDTLTPVVIPLTNFSYNAKAGIVHYKGGTFSGGYGDYDYGVFDEGFQNIQVKYTAGYGAAIANLPEDLKLAAALQVEFYYKRDTADFSTTFDEGMILKAEPKALAPRVKDILDAYKRCAF